MSQSDNDGRQSDFSQDVGGLGAPDASGKPVSDKQTAGQSQDRQWTLRRIEGVIGSVA
ncbi:MAG: hypothetical protein AAF965_02845 [Pseudomonadota bacterium]